MPEERSRLRLLPEEFDALLFCKLDKRKFRIEAMRRLKIVMDSAGPEHPLCSLCLSTASSGYIHHHLFNEAKTSIRRSLSILRNSIGEENELGSLARRTLGKLHLVCGDLVLAEKETTKALVYEEGLPESYQEPVILRMQLAEIAHKQGRANDAIKLCVDILEENDGVNSISHAKAYRLLSRLSRRHRALRNLSADVEHIEAESCDLKIAEMYNYSGHSFLPIIKTLIKAVEVLVNNSNGQADLLAGIARWFNRISYDISTWADNMSAFVCTHPGFGVAPDMTTWSRESWFMELQERGYSLGRGNTVPAGHSPSPFGAKLTYHASQLSEAFAWLKTKNHAAFDELNSLVGFAYPGAPALFSPLMAVLGHLHNMWYHKAAVLRELPAPPFRYTADAVLDVLLGKERFHQEIETFANEHQLPYLMPSEYSVALERKLEEVRE